MAAGETRPLVAMCHEAVWRIRQGQTRYQEELERLCEQFDERPENVRELLDRMMSESPGEAEGRRGTG